MTADSYHVAAAVGYHTLPAHSISSGTMYLSLNHLPRHRRLSSFARGCLLILRTSLSVSGAIGLTIRPPKNLFFEVPLPISSIVVPGHSTSLRQALLSLLPALAAPTLDIIIHIFSSGGSDQACNLLLAYPRVTSAQGALFSDAQP